MSMLSRLNRCVVMLLSVLCLLNTNIVTCIAAPVAASVTAAESYTANTGFDVPSITLPRSGVSAKQLALIINERDPVSVQIGYYYQQSREIPRQNVIRVRFDPYQSEMQPGAFVVMQKLIEAQLPAGIEAYALAWSSPYKVGCMSITSAFAFGYNQDYCIGGCKLTRRSEYFRSSALQPFSQLGIRPAMMLSARNIKEAEQLIDRGIAADGSWPNGRALLLETPDKARSVRKVYFPLIEQQLGERIEVVSRKGRNVKDQRRLMFYFTGDRVVKHIASNHFYPGAMADHLTSSGGQLIDSLQMSAMRWLEGGATGSYGTVVEPCNHLGKFPNPLLAMDYYLKGATLLEAYWKSVEMPGQGVFIGEPLASPYRAYRLQWLGDSWLLWSPVLTSGRYKLLAADQAGGAYYTVHPSLRVKANQAVELMPPIRPFYRLERL